MHWVTALSPGGEKSYNDCLVIVYRYRKNPIFLPCHKDDTAMDTALFIWNRTYGLAERIIQTLEEIIRRFCAYGLEFKDSDGLTHDWCTLIPALELAYKTSIHSSTGNTPAILEKGWNPKLPVDALKKDLVNIQPTSSSFKLFLDKVRHNENKTTKDAYRYAKIKWDKSHKSQEVKVGDLKLVSTLKLIILKAQRN
ncbi:hypothetical protein O181_060437 [Austropuccinia psidii MF-1]|uniref:Integrase catalytic domain-containing protein n=1 Tax=Austropuccinia psidii MF-1 TaxID=1389203 RepID=A0A9Q3HYF3_9BASI|nr:hypothetical protein [Austropuccinia psidii MF-1]